VNVSGILNFTATYQNLYFIDTTAGNLVITMPNATPFPQLNSSQQINPNGAQVAFKKISNDPNTITLKAITPGNNPGNNANQFVPQQIDGGATLVFNQPGTCIQMVTDGANWWLL
jgi:hypothetical protein